MISISLAIVQTDKILLPLRQNLKYSINRVYFKKVKSTFKTMFCRTNDISEMNKLRGFPNWYLQVSHSKVMYWSGFPCPLIQMARFKSFVTVLFHHGPRHSIVYTATLWFQSRVMLPHTSNPQHLAMFADHDLQAEMYSLH